MPGGHCLRCLLGLGLKSGDPDLEDENPAARVVDDEFPGYDILEKIGEGGCGMVYRAAQSGLVRREVAIKVIKLGMDTRAVIARFEAERHVLALMNHPSIARVFDAGITGRGRPFFVMEFVAGEHITDYCDRKQLSVAQRLGLFLQVCEAVRHAHLRGIIHRDLKPSNIIVTETDGRPVPKVIDFGVAKAMGHQRLADRTIYTAFEQFVGTPAYMSPEQAGLTGEDIDARSDIYALGVLLYELLTGRPPFEPERLRKAAIDEICRIIREEDPSLPSARLTSLSVDEMNLTAQRRMRPPKRLVSDLRGDLDGIVMKSMEKSRKRRYETVGELAADISRHLNHEPVTARPPGVCDGFLKFARRNTLLLGASTLVLASLIAGLAVCTWMYLREKRSRGSLEHRAYLTDMSAACRSAMRRPGGLGGALKLLDSWKTQRPDLRDWEWYYLKGLCHQEMFTIHADEGELWSVSWNPDGKSIATGSEGGAVKLWDAATGRSIASFAGHVGVVRCVAWAPRGDILASAGDDHTIRLWNVETRQHTSLAGHGGHVAALAWSPDGKWLASGSEDGSVKLWDPGTGSLRQTLIAGKHVNAVCWSGDGSRIFACGRNEMTIAWDFASRKKLWSNVIESGDDLNTVTCSPNGRELAFGGMRNIIVLLDPATGKTLLSLFGNSNSVLSVAWSPDGSRLASTTRGDGRIVIRDTAIGGRIIREFRGHLGSVRSLAWRPDGSRLASASTDGTVKIWDVLSRSTSYHALRQPDQAKTIAWSPDGTQLAVAGRRTFPWIRDFTRGGVSVAMDAGYSPVTMMVAWSPDGSRLATAGGKGLVVFDPATRLPAWQDPATSPPITRAVAWNPAGTRLAALKDGTLTLWDSSIGKPLKSIKLPASTTWALGWSPDGRTIAIGAHQGIHLFDAFLTPVRSLPGHREGINCLVWSPDSTRLASAGGDGCVIIRDIRNGRILHTLSGHGAPVQGLAWNPSGTRLASGSRDLSLKLWDPATGDEVCSFDRPAGIDQSIEAVAWSPDGKRLAVSDREGYIGILDASPGWLVDSGASAAQAPDTRKTPEATAETIRSLLLFCETAEPHAGNDPDALRRLAWIRATSPYAQVRDGRKAVQFAELANQVTGGRQAGLLFILAAAYAEAGDFEKAVATQEKSTSLLSRTGEAQTYHAAALKLYESRQPFRDHSF
jgi:WD40 repeat protein/serine/threonine protein kinase